VRPGGELLLTVPVGRGERFPWVRTFTLDELAELLAAFGGEPAGETYFRHGARGWDRVTRDEVTDARYRDHHAGVRVEDGVVAAEAVACATIRIPA
jgi:hypothetical protein